MGIPAVAAGLAVVNGGGLVPTSYEYGVAVMVLAGIATVNLIRFRTQKQRFDPGGLSMTDARPHLTPGPDHPITLERSPSHVVVRSGSVLIADTDRALEMQEASYPTVWYVPLDDVDQGVLRRSDRHTYCPYKGEASYYDIVDGDGTDLTAAVWFYDDPFPSVADIKDHVAFYADRVTVTATPRESTVRSHDRETCLTGGPAREHHSAGTR